jgi:acyl-CoA synthetase (AMP-forming)/AMP-acid ligase II
MLKDGATPQHLFPPQAKLAAHRLHPAIAQVVAFAVPHPKLGEEVGAAVVLREGHQASEREIRDFAAARMADFKVPRHVVILAEIPKGATGKLQRIGLAEKLGLTAAP